MVIDCGKDELIRIINERLTFMGFVQPGGGITNSDIIEESLERTEYCFSKSINKRYCSEKGEVYYSIRHSTQSSIFLYYLSNTAHKHNDVILADSIYYLNKIMHGVDWFYEIDLPLVFGAEHPVGSVLGRATYGNRLFVHQNTTVGSSLYKFPTIGDNVVLCANSCVLGDCHIGNNCIISAGTIIINQHVPGNSIIFRDGSVHIYQEHIIKEKIKVLTDFAD